MAEEGTPTRHAEGGDAAGKTSGSSRAEPGDTPSSAPGLAAPGPCVPTLAGAVAPTICGLHPHHVRQLCLESGIDPAVVTERGYRTVETKAELRRLGFSKGQQDTLDPKNGKYCWVAPSCWPGRPAPAQLLLKADDPRISKGKERKYDRQPGRPMGLDSPPRCHADLGNPRVPLFITEGFKKVDCACSRGGCWISVNGVWNWRGENADGGKTVLADFEQVALNGRKVYLVFDSDIVEKMPVYRALERLRGWLKSKGADVWIIYLPSKPTGEKMGVDDWYVEGPSRILDDLLKLAKRELVKPALDPRETEMKRVEDVLPGLPSGLASGLVVPLGYELGSGGVAQLRLDRRAGDDLEERRVSIAPEPVFIAGRMEDIFTNEQLFVLVYRQGERWVRRAVERSVAMDARRLVSLAGQGFPTTSGRAGGVVEYLADFESANTKRLPVAKTTTQMGWQPGGSSRDYLWGEDLQQEGA